ncbi:MAG: putative outer membrane protein Omp85 [Chlamydiia bacterium]|nr:putative outer membrane protein Omp85 [Chlamydiia bacterium]
MKALIRYVLTILLFIPQLIQAAESYDNVRIQKVEIVVSNKEDSNEVASIRGRMKTKEGNLFSQTDFDEDLKSLAKEFDTIVPTVNVVDDKIVVGLRITPKPIINSITVKGNKAVILSRLEKELGIRRGAVYDRAQFNKAFHKLKNYYVRKGYFEAELNYGIKRDEENNKVDIEIQIQEGRSGRIKEIIFRNFSKKERHDILDQMHTKEYFILTSWATDEGTHKPEVLRMDELTILNYLHNQGYADAKVDTKIEQADANNRINIVITANKGELYHFDDWKVEGAKVLTSKEVAALMPFKKGDPYSPEKVSEASKLISENYGRRGYVDVMVSPQASLVEGKRCYNGTFFIEEGERFRVGLIKVSGNTKTEASVILHESLLSPGEIFDATLLNKTEERLRNVGYFSSVNVYAVKAKEQAPGAANFRDVHIEVAENPTTANFRASIGYSTNPSQVTGTLGVSEYNFNSKGIPHIFSKGLRGLRGGGEFLGFEATIGSKVRSYTLSWSKPYFLDTQWTIGSDLNKTRNDYASPDYGIKSYSAYFYGRYQLNAFLKFGMHYRIQHSFIKLSDRIHHSRRNHELIRESKNGGLISAVGAEYMYDSTNHPVFATQGLRSTIGAEYAGLGGDHTFAKFNYFNSYFWSLYKGGVFRLRGNLQFIQALGSTHPRDIPLSERLYSGGESTIRGFVYNRVGPKFHDKDRTIRGGMSEVLLSAEFNQYCFKKLDVFAFFDAGNVYFSQFYLGTLRASWGYGIKIKIRENAAPIAIGIGNPINPQSREDVKRFFLSFNTSF